MKKIIRSLTELQVTAINIVCIVVVMASCVFIGVRLASGPAWIKSFDLSSKGTLGDAVNGLSAPFISFFSAILIYITFREQVKANKLLQSQWQIDTFLKVFNDMTSRLNNIHEIQHENVAGSFSQTYEYRGLEVATYLAENFDFSEKEVPNSVVEFIYLMDELTFLAELVNEAPPNRRGFMRQKITRFYFSGFHVAIYKLNKVLPLEQGGYKAFSDARIRMNKQLERFITARDLINANGEGQEHEDLRSYFPK